LALSHLVIEFRTPQEGLAGNTPLVKTDTAHFLLFHHRRLHAQLCRPDGGDIAAGACPQDDKIVVIRHGCFSTPFFSLSMVFSEPACSGYSAHFAKTCCGIGAWSQSVPRPCGRQLCSWGCGPVWQFRTP